MVHKWLGKVISNMLLKYPSLKELRNWDTRKIKTRRGGNKHVCNTSKNHSCLLKLIKEMN